MTPTEAAVRSRFHPVDWNEVDGIVNLAVAEGTLAEARLRIMDEQRPGAAVPYAAAPSRWPAPTATC